MTVKTEMTTTAQQPMMSSREIAALTGKDVNKVHRDIRAMVPALYSVDSGDDVKSYAWGTSKSEMNAFLVHHNIQGVIPNYDDRGYVYEFLLDRRHTEILVSGYDIKRRAVIIDRWHALESGEAQPRIAAQQDISAHPDILSLARVVAEATASAMMKAVMEVSGTSLVAAASVSPAEAQQRISSTGFVNTDSEFEPVHKVSWETGLSDPSCRRLIQFANLPSRQLPGVRGLCVHRESFINAFQVLLEESVRPSGKRKRWQHPEFGGFVLRKDPKQIFAEVEA
ncbi:Rha family transcriptional regulator [Salmonella enterica]|nr:transcriptional regulator [Salmonella enterica]ELY9958707.1 Rha family transcriptional regulator [Salmonella enterica]